MRYIKFILAVASMAMLLVAFASPALARTTNWNWNNGFDNGVFQSNGQAVRSGDSNQAIDVTGGGANSNSCQGVQGINNTGSSLNSTGVLQVNPFDTGFGAPFVDGFFNPGFNTGEVGVGGVGGAGNFEMKPWQSTTCQNAVNQAASAS